MTRWQHASALEVEVAIVNQEAYGFLAIDDPKRPVAPWTDLLGIIVPVGIRQKVAWNCSDR